MARKIFYSFIVCLLFIIILELGLRFTHLFGAKTSWVEPDPLLGSRLTPNMEYCSVKESNHPIRGRINKYGWRDKTWSAEKPKGTFRIAVLGDSFVEAINVESEDTFLSLSERLLNEGSNIRFELMNFGISGATQTEEFLILKNSVTKFSPDMVILFFLPFNDIDDIAKETASNKIRPFYRISENGGLILDTSFNKSWIFKLKQNINWVKQHSATISLMTERYNIFRDMLHYRNIWHKRDLSTKIPGYLSLCTSNADKTYLQNYELNKKIIKAMAEFCENKKIRFMLVTIPISAHIPEDEKRYEDIDLSFNSNFFDNDLKKFAQSINIEYLGLQPIFRDIYEKDGIVLYWERNNYWGHWNCEGHKVVARALFNKLKDIK